MEWLFKLLRDNGGFFRINRDPDPEPAPGGADPAPEPAPGDPEPVKVDNQPGDPAPQYKAPEIDMTTAIPPEHRNKEYFKDITFEKMVNEFVALETKLGERPPVGVPAADAKPEDIQKFYNSLRPEDLNAYVFPETEFSKAKGRDEAFQTSMKEVFHKAGISQHQANLLTEGYDAVLAKMDGVSAEAEKQFDDKITELYKDDREAVLTKTKNLMIENIPDEMKPLLEGLPNSALLLLTATLNSVHNKYIKEDTIGPGNVPATGDPVALRQEAMSIMQSPEFKDFRNPGYDAAQQKVKDIYSQIAQIQAGTTKK